MEMSAGLGQPVQEAAGPSPVSRVVLEDLAVGYGFKHFVESSVLLHHLTLGVLCEANALRSGLGAEALDNRADFVGIRCLGHAARPVVCTVWLLGLAGHHTRSPSAPR
jgi:hypothetical protein